MRIDSEILAKMSEGEKAEFAIWAELLDSKGYELLCQFLQGNSDSVHAVKRDALNFVLNLETILENRVMEMHVTEDVEELEEALSL
jgi:hypothetical protein